MNLSKNVRVVQLTTARTLAFTTRFSKALDMSGFDNVMFVVQGSTVLLANTSAKVYAQGCTSTSGTWRSYQGHAHSTQTSGVNYRNFLLDVIKPTKRYIRCRVTGSSSAALAINSILAFQYNARFGGSTHIGDSTTIADSTAIIGSTS